MRVVGRKDIYSFNIAFGGEWISVAGDVDASILSTQIGGGFTGVVLGIYATK